MAAIAELAWNHALVDGNKRLAWSATRAFCLLNHHDRAFTVDNAEQFVLAVAGVSSMSLTSRPCSNVAFDPRDARPTRKLRSQR